MTKIDQIQESLTIQATRRPTASATDMFQESLKNALSQLPAETADNRQAAALGEPQSVHAPPAVPAETDVANRTDRLLNLLDSYATSLDNPAATLKDLDPLVTRIKEEAEQLMASADSQPSTADHLKGIAAQTVLTANVEVLKFQRGDYI